MGGRLAAPLKISRGLAVGFEVKQKLGSVLATPVKISTGLAVPLKISRGWLRVVLNAA
jgi:hypothetical protein